MDYEEINRSMRSEKKEIENLLRAKGKEALSEIAKFYGVRIWTIRKHLTEVGIFYSQKSNPDLEALAQQGLPQTGIAKKLSISRQAVSQYLSNHGLNAAHRERRAAAKERKQLQALEKNAVMGQFYSLMLQRRLDLAKKEGWVTEQAVKAFLKPNCDLRRIRSFPKYIRILKVWEDAKKKGERPSLEQMAKRSGIKNPNEVRRILVEGVGKEALFSTRNRTIYSPGVKQIIRRAYYLGMNYPDITYMIKIAFGLDVPKYVVGCELSKIGPRDRKRELIKGLAPSSSRVFVPLYEQASKLYEAVHNRAGIPEIREELNLSNEAVKYLLDNKKRITNEILNALDTIQPEKKHTKPY